MRTSENEEIEVRTGYMNATDFAHHLGEEPKFPAKVYATIESVLQFEPYAKSCGIIEVQVRLIKNINTDKL